MRYDSRYPSRQRVAHGRVPQSRAPRRRAPTAFFILADVLAAALLMLVFYITNYVITPDVEATPLTPPPTTASAPINTEQPAVTDSPATSAPATKPGKSASAAPQQTATAKPAPTLPGMFRSKFPDKFTTGAVEKTDTSYKSANVNVTYKKVQQDGVIYYLADVYIADLKYFKTGFGVGSSKPGPAAHVSDSLKAVQGTGVIGINGDFCTRNPSLLIRNGIFFNKWSKSSSDELVMYNDGTMKAFSASQFNWDQTKADAPYQVWGFGPMLLTDGQPMTKFNSTVNKANPRTAIGYYEPGHYCFVTVDGRQDDSSGYTTAQLSSLFYSLHCKEAFNLDGGGSSQMAFMGNLISDPCSDFRPVDDFIYIADY